MLLFALQSFFSYLYSECIERNFWAQLLSSGDKHIFIFIVQKLDLNQGNTEHGPKKVILFWKKSLVVQALCIVTLSCWKT